LHLVLRRDNEQDITILKCECAPLGEMLPNRITSTLRAVVKLGGSIELVAPGSLPNDRG
jgi:phenylacetate-CoA ligase